MWYYFAVVMFWVVSVAASLYIGRPLERFVAGSAAMVMVIIAPMIMGISGICSWNVAMVLNVVGYAAYYLSDILFSSSPYEVSKAKD